MEAMINAGVHAVAVHARQVGDEATNPANWKSLQSVFDVMRPKYPDFPFPINGDFYKRDEISDMMSKAGANAVLLAGPALYDTSIFGKETDALEDKTIVVQRYAEKAVNYNVNHKK